MLKYATRYETMAALDSIALAWRNICASPLLYNIALMVLKWSFSRVAVCFLEKEQKAPP